METTVSKLCIASKLSTQLLEITSLMRFWGASLCFGQTETTCSVLERTEAENPDGLNRVTVANYLKITI